MSQDTALNKHQPTFDQLAVKDQNAITEGLKYRANRRDILKWMGLSGIGFAAGEAILASATSALAQTPKPGGKFRVALQSTGSTETLDPARQTYVLDYARARSFFNTLTRIGTKGDAESDLAESFEYSRDGREWIFRLRKGVEFHDGKTLTSQDVVYSLMRHKDPATASIVKVLMDPVKAVIADGPQIVRIKLSSPNADTPLIFGTSHFAIIQDGTKDFSKAIGTGPYRLEGSFTPGTGTTGKKNSNYFFSGRPHFDEVFLFGIPDKQARANALFSGDVDAISDLIPSVLGNLSSRPDLVIMDTKTSSFSQILMMLDRKPTDNLDFRQAIKHLLDRERFLNIVQKGYGQLGNDHIVPPSNPLYNKDLPQRTVDLDKADFHLRKASMKGARVELFVSDASPGSVEMGQILQQTAARAGLTINLKREPADGYWSNIYMKKPFIGSRWIARPTLDILLTLGWLSNAKWNDSHLRDPNFDKLVIEARGEGNAAKRKALYGEIQKYLYDKGGNGIYAFVDFVDGLSARVKGLKPNPTSNLGAYYFDTAWFG